jgi:long-chain acyl-CoA synthetase
VLCEYPAVAEVCAVGVTEEAQGERVKAFVVVKDPSEESAELAATLIEHCRVHLIEWSRPRHEMPGRLS